MVAPVRPGCFQQIRSGIQRCRDAARRQITRLCCCSSAPAAAAAAAAPAPAPVAAAVVAVAGPAIAAAPAALAASAPRPKAYFKLPDELEPIGAAAAPAADDPAVLEGIKRKVSENLVQFGEQGPHSGMVNKLLEADLRDSEARLVIDIRSVQICLRAMVPPGAAAAPHMGWGV